MDRIVARAGHDGSKHYITIQVADQDNFRLQVQRPKSSRPDGKVTTLTLSADSPADLVRLARMLSTEMQGVERTAMEYETQQANRD